jgi:tetratricopeptide (TPR) repeat protein
MCGVQTESMRQRCSLRKSLSLLSILSLTAGSTLATSIAFAPLTLAQSNPAPVANPSPVASPPPANPAATPINAAVAPAVSQILPYDTMGVLLINPNEAVWEDLSRFRLFPKDFSTPGVLFESIASNTNYDLDIQPWLAGHVAIAMLSGPGKPEERFVTLAPVKASEAVPQFLTKVKAGRKLDKLVEKDYKGVKILLWEPEKIDLGPIPDMEPDDGVDVPTFSQRSVGQPSPKFSLSKLLTPGKSPIAAGSTPAPTPLPETPPSAQPDGKPEGEMPGGETPKPSDEAPDWLSTPGFAIAYVPTTTAKNAVGYIVASQHLDIVQAVIDAQGQEKSLATHPDFQRTIADPRFEKSLFAGYSDYNQLMQASLKGAPESLKRLYQLPPFALPKGTDPELAKRLEQIYGALDGYVWAEPEGLRVQGTVYLKESLPPELLQQINSPNGLAKRMPDVNYAVMTSYNLAFFWRALESGLSADPDFKKGIDSFRLFSQSSFGVDDRDIFPWMDQEYGTFSFPSKGGLLPTAIPNLDIGMGAMFQTSDRPAAEAALKKLEAQAKKMGGKSVQFKAVNVNGQALTSIEVPGPKGKAVVSVVAYGWVAPDTLMVLSGKDTAANLVPVPGRSLDQSSHFKAAMLPFPQENLGYFYANPNAMLALANQFGVGQYLNTPLPDDPEMTIASMIGSIRSVSGISAVTANTATSDGFLSVSSRPIQKLTATELRDRGNRKLVGGDYNGAIAALSRSLRLDNQVADTHRARGEARVKIRDHQGAIEDFNQALSLEPQNGQALSGRGTAKIALFDYPGAIGDFTTVIDKLQPTSDDYTSRGAAKSALADYAGSLADANAALKLSEGDIIALNNRCFAKGMLGDLKGALIDCNQGIEFDTSGQYLSTLYADRCFVRAKQAEKDALKDCGIALEIDAQDGFIWESQGYARQALGDKKGAKFSFEKAKELFKDDALSVERVNRAIAAL